MLVPSLIDKSIHRTVSLPLLIHFERKRFITDMVYVLFKLSSRPEKSSFLHNHNTLHPTFNTSFRSRCMYAAVVYIYTAIIYTYLYSSSLASSLNLQDARARG